MVHIGGHARDGGSVDDDNASMEVREVVESVVHPSWDPANIQRGHDIAILELSLESEITPVRLHTGRMPLRSGLPLKSKEAAPALKQPNSLKVNFWSNFIMASHGCSRAVPLVHYVVYCLRSAGMGASGAQWAVCGRPASGGGAVRLSNSLQRP